jgi:outer membrane lipoprotein-sorting protein
MKKIICILLVAFSMTAVAQETLNEGVIKSKMVMSSSNPDVQMQLDMVGEMLSTTYFKDDKTRTEVKNMMTGESTNIIDSTEKKMLVIMNNPMAGGKVYAENSYEATEEDLKDVTITKSDETRTFLGYECIKYDVVVNKNGAEVQMEIYATDKISAINQQTTSFGDEFNGFPLFMEMHMNQNGMEITMTMEVNKIENETVSADKFDMTPPEGYKKVDKLQGM